ncbi:MAG: hypothetical protein R2823_04225 [Acidimicrobiia bacterium]
MEEPILVAVEVPIVGDERRKNWAKIVTGVDESLATGWAFDGDFIATGGIQDVPIGSVILAYGERGSRVNPQIEASVMRVNADATVTPIAAAKGRAWARTLRDPIVELLAEANDAPIEARPWDPSLLAFSDDAIAREVERRGL